MYISHTIPQIDLDSQKLKISKKNWTEYKHSGISMRKSQLPIF